jgi:hypothetical protein
MACETDPVKAYLSEIGRRGGAKRVPKGAAVLPAAERKRTAQALARARWDAYYAAHPEKLQAKQAKLAREAKRPASARREK